ncbi:MAG: DUF5004 domain-containing protein [Luteibaculaceae bacterium]
MKTLFNILGLAALLFVTSACQKELELGPEPDRNAGLSGTWTLTRVVQVDFTDPARRTRDVSRFFIDESNPQTARQISFNAVNRTFTLSEGGLGPNYLGGSGTWSFDDERFPSRILVTRENEGTAFWVLNSPIRPQESRLRFSIVRSCDGEQIVGYRYEFERN